MSDDSKKEGELPPTEMLYMTYEGNWLQECEASVVGVEMVPLAEDEPQQPMRLKLFLDRTVMHAQGGGQPTDQGTITKHHEEDEITVKVEKVTVDRESGVATHLGVFESADGDEGLSPIQKGDSVKVKIDSEQRLELSECHTAGHVVDAAMAKCGKFFKPSKAYHFLNGPYVEYEGSIDAKEKDDLLQNLQTAFCELVDQDIPTTIELMSKEGADAVCNRVAQNFDMEIFADKRSNQIRVVTVAGFPCPCGGTHVRSTGALKGRGWGIKSLKSKKGVVQVKYQQGLNK